MSDSDTAPAPRKPQPKPRSRRLAKARSDSIGSPTASSPTTLATNNDNTTTASNSLVSSPPPHARRRTEDDFFSKARNYREIVKVQAETFLQESVPETTEIEELEPIIVSDEIPILDFEDEAKISNSQTAGSSSASVIDLDGPVDPIDLDSDQELDPELASIAAKFSSASSQSQQSLSQQSLSQADISSQPNSSNNLSETPSSSLDAVNSSPTQPSVEIKLLIRHMAFPPRTGSLEQMEAKPIPGESLKVNLLDDTSFRKVMQVYCEATNLEFSKVIFTFKKSRLIPSSTPRSLQFPPIAVVDAYETGAYKYMKEIETRRLEELDRQARELAELDNIPNGRGQEGKEDDKNDGVIGEEEVEYLHIKLRGKDTADEKIRVKKAIKKIPEGVPIKLEFDDEVIDPSMSIGETDVEDDDMLVVRVG
ncbi:hypothetical protein BGZ46_002577 [Entomortierella lignicola]|nr:hypothetical protein BGZ46_002577 [Entomortierella lignicola]